MYEPGRRSFLQLFSYLLPVYLFKPNHCVKLRIKHLSSISFSHTSSMLINTSLFSKHRSALLYPDYISSLLTNCRQDSNHYISIGTTYIHSLVLYYDMWYYSFRHVDQIYDGTGAKLGMLLQYSATCASAFIIAFIANWRLSVFILPISFLCLVAPHSLDKVCLTVSQSAIR